MLHDRIELKPLATDIGADVEGLSLASLADAPDDLTLACLKEALKQHVLLRVRSQSLTPRQFVTVAGFFGPIRGLRQQVNTRALHIESEPAIKVVSNAKVDDGRPLGD